MLGLGSPSVSLSLVEGGEPSLPACRLPPGPSKARSWLWTKAAWDEACVWLRVEVKATAGNSSTGSKAFGEWPFFQKFRSHSAFPETTAEPARCSMHSDSLAFWECVAGEGSDVRFDLSRTTFLLTFLPLGLLQTCEDRSTSW